MRNGKTLLQCMGVLVVLAVVTTGLPCMTASTVMAAPDLEATESGAPSAMVIFPVTDNPNPTRGGVRPVVFNHLIHEQAVTDCETCHHTGDTVSCTSCHTVEGKEEGNFVTLEKAMHAVNIPVRHDGLTTPSSCVSCHTENLKQRDCAGCHSILPSAPRNSAYCTTCHDVTEYMTDAQFIQGVKGELSAEENEELAAETVWVRKNAEPVSSRDIPIKVKIDALSDKYQASVFNHARHYSSLVKSVGDNALAAAFHQNPTSLCSACHHNSPPSMTPPKCGSCHAAKVSAKTSDMPALKEAYHLQCMGCHDAMKVSRPQNTSCVTCHKERVN